MVLSKLSKRALSASYPIEHIDFVLGPAPGPALGARSARPVTDNRQMTNNHIFIGKRRGFEQTFEAHVVIQTPPVVTQLITLISSWGRTPGRPAGPGRLAPLYRLRSGSKHPHFVGETVRFEQTFEARVAS